MHWKSTRLVFHRDVSATIATEHIVLLTLVACFVIAGVRVYGQTLFQKLGWADQRVAKFVTF